VSALWLRIQVELLGGGGIECVPPPGRVFLLGPAMTFGDLAEVIDSAFARYDIGHLHGFELSDGRMIGIPDDGSLEPDWIDETTVIVATAVAPGDAFEYTFDFGEDWRHRCSVLNEVDPVEEWDEEPPGPVVIDGWGWIPDQYGRQSAEVEE
jgi:hypothetical protein